MNAPLRSRSQSAVAVGLLALLTACSSFYYGTMEALGVEKRELLSDRVEAGRDEQQQAKRQFQSALEAFKEVTAFQGGALEQAYDKLNGELEKCERRAAAVSARIASIEKVAADLFEEWTRENQDYTNPDLRSKSVEMLQNTKRRYGLLLITLRKAEASMAPVLGAFRDQVMFLKHNLNAQAIAALQDSVVEIEADIATLMADMELSIAESDAFIESMG